MSLQAKLCQLFPTWESIRLHEEVVKFACGLASEPEALIEVVSERLTLYVMEDNMPTSEDDNVLMSVAHEIQGKTSVNPLKNKYVHYVFCNPKTLDEWSTLSKKVIYTGVRTKAVLSCHFVNRQDLAVINKYL